MSVEMENPKIVEHDNILLIDYPSGGYGFYLTRLINRYCSNIVRTEDTFEFDDLGTSHSVPLVYGDIHHNHNQILSRDRADPRYHQSINRGNIILVPYCPGITTDRIQDTLETYSKARLVRLWYDDRTWPLVFYNAINKALRGDVEVDIEFDPEKFGSSDSWARRENFMLLFKTHRLRNQWKPVTHPRIININILDLLINTEKCLCDIGGFLKISVACHDLDVKHRNFLKHNPAIGVHLSILHTLDRLQDTQDLSHIDQLYWQAVFNFYLETTNNISIPVNDFPDWFENTAQINKMLFVLERDRS